VALNRAARVTFSFEPEIPAFGRDKPLESYLPSRVQKNPAELFPAAIVGPRNTPRMAAQLGTFTVNHPEIRARRLPALSPWNHTCRQLTVT
jgi:hypothetical protein